jgi:hypothetical protein
MRAPRPYWTKTELGDLIAMVVAGFTIGEISEITGRTERAIYQKLQRSGMIFTPIHKRKK